MSHATRARFTLVITIVAAVAISGGPMHGQAGAVQPTNDLPNPYQTIEGWAKMPEGRTWGSTSAVEIDKDGRSIWVAERCGANSCLDRKTGQMSNLPSILKFDASGKLVKSFGEGMLIFPHGIHVDRDGNVWVTDGQDNAPAPAPTSGAGAGGGAAAGGAGAAAGAGGGAGGGGGQGAAASRMGPLPGATKGHQVYKFSPEGKLLLTLGKPGGAAEPDFFYQPNDVVTAPNGDIFVGEGHGGGNGRILKFSKDGKFIKAFGKKGAGPGEFEQPHALAMDSKGRLFVGDRSNNRIQMLDQDGKFLDEWKQFSRPSGIYIDKQDTLYVADSESESVSQTHNGWKRGIRTGRISDGKVTAFIPDPETRSRPDFTGTSAAEGVAVDAEGNIYGAEVGPRALKKYVRKTGGPTQASVAPVNDLPNPYQTITGYFKLPEGRTWGSTSAVEIDKDGRSIWVAERCGGNTCAGSALDPILKFDASGKVVKSFGGGMFLFPHGIHVDRDGNVWITDAQGPDGKDPKRDGKGHQVIKFSPEGKVLLTLGKAGVAGDGTSELLNEPNDVVTAPNGDIFVADGHSGQNMKAPPNTVARIAKFTRDGKFIKSWGKLGSGPGEFRTPHGLAFDSRGRLFVADRGNVRIQIFDQEGKFLDEWKQFSRLSGIYIDKNDMLYGVDSESSPDNHPGWRRGMRIGSARDGKVLYFIPDPELKPAGTSAAEGVAADAAGNIYGAEVGPRQVQKYVKKSGS